MLVLECKVSFMLLLYQSLLWVSCLGLFSIHTRLFLMLVMECRVSFMGLLYRSLFLGLLFGSLLNAYTSLFDIGDGMPCLFYGSFFCRYTFHLTLLTECHVCFMGLFSIHTRLFLILRMECKAFFFPPCTYTSYSTLLILCLSRFRVTARIQVSFHLCGSHYQVSFP